jgi:hypothetical protein
MCKLSLDDIAGSDLLCKHCVCTNYGIDMSCITGNATKTGCEGTHCGDAYADYLDSEEDD